MEFTKYRCASLKPRKLRILQRKQGIQVIFQKMAELRDGYEFIHPVRLWKHWQDPKTALRAAGCESYGAHHGGALTECKATA
jgi:hypothetical protein